MIQDVKNYPISTLFDIERGTTYVVPKYQREYVWATADWDALVDDLLDEESADGHFLGTFICVNRTTDAYASPDLEVIDGQQRLTSISLLLAAIYHVLSEEADRSDVDELTNFTNLKRMLVQNKKPRLTPQTVRKNLDDFLHVYRSVGLMEGFGSAPKRFGTRRIALAFSHFSKRIDQYAESQKTSRLDAANYLLARVKRAQLVKLEVNSYADAYKLFESLNNRGRPLTPIDLIKNTLLAHADRDSKKTGITVDDAYDKWRQWIDELGDDYGIQERFFRHLYAAMKEEWNLTVPKATIATRSNLMRVYEHLIKSDLHALISHLSTATPVYSRLTTYTDTGPGVNELDRALTSLLRAQGTPSHILLLFVLLKQEELGLEEKNLVALTRLLIAFSVRRNLTNQPPTNAVPRMLMELIGEIRKSEQSVLDVVRAKIIEVSASDDHFLDKLRGEIYAENTDVTRFILTSLAEQQMATKENWQDLWARDPNRRGVDAYRWTIEHILPQSEGLGAEWIRMLGGAEEAQDAQSRLVHRLGNLTLTGYNSSLGKLSFVEKRDRENKEGHPIGYKNGFSLNNELALLSTWSPREIENRTTSLAEQASRLFALD